MEGQQMKKTMGALAFVLVVASACAAPREAPLYGCNAYAAALTTLAAFRSQGKLSVAQVGVVDRVRGVVNPICTAPTPPTNADVLGTISFEVAKLVLLQTEVSP